MTAGTLMIIAWMITSSVAMVVARHYKETKPVKELCGQKAWFQVIESGHVLTAIITTTSEATTKQQYIYVQCKRMGNIKLANPVMPFLCNTLFG